MALNSWGRMFPAKWILAVKSKIDLNWPSTLAFNWQNPETIAWRFIGVELISGWSFPLQVKVMGVPAAYELEIMGKTVARLSVVQFGIWGVEIGMLMFWS